jgi:hypothetical protein
MDAEITASVYISFATPEVGAKFSLRETAPARILNIKQKGDTSVGAIPPSPVIK